MGRHTGLAKTIVAAPASTFSPATTPVSARSTALSITPLHMVDNVVGPATILDPTVSHGTVAGDSDIVRDCEVGVPGEPNALGIRITGTGHTFDGNSLA
ncbi:MAG: hypothetical protein Kow0059_19120 [Candidatus Sumerlaeia bacterium]